jgi:hypothetical protein
MLSKREIAKLGLKQRIEQALVEPTAINQVPNDQPVHNRIQSTSASVHFQCPVNTVESADTVMETTSGNNNNDTNNAPILEGDDDEYGFSDEDQYSNQQVDDEDLEVYSPISSNIAKGTNVQKTLLEVLREWLANPTTLGITEEAITQLVRLIHLYKPTFGPNDLPRFPTTGKGIVKLPKKHFVHVKFRDLNEYRSDTKDFPEVVITKKIPVRSPPKRITETKVQPPSAVAGRNNEEDEDISDNNEEDNISLVSEQCDDSDSDDGRDGNLADSEGEGDEVEKPMLVDHLEDCDVEMVVGDDVNDADGVNKQMDDDENNKKLVSEMAYFGVENVLTGRNPGLLDHRGFQNVIKAIALLSDYCLSDFFVDKFFPKSSPNSYNVSRH